MSFCVLIFTASLPSVTHPKRTHPSPLHPTKITCSPKSGKKKPKKKQKKTFPPNKSLLLQIKHQFLQPFLVSHDLETSHLLGEIRSSPLLKPSVAPQSLLQLKFFSLAFKAPGSQAEALFPISPSQTHLKVTCSFLNFSHLCAFINATLPTRPALPPWAVHPSSVSPPIGSCSLLH